MGKHLKTLIKEKPESATHYDKGFGRYLDCKDQFNIKYWDGEKWIKCLFSSTGKRIVYLGV